MKVRLGFILFSKHLIGSFLVDTGLFSSDFVKLTFDLQVSRTNLSVALFSLTSVSQHSSLANFISEEIRSMLWSLLDAILTSSIAGLLDKMVSILIGSVNKLAMMISSTNILLSAFKEASLALSRDSVSGVVKELKINTHLKSLRQIKNVVITYLARRYFAEILLI